MVSRRPLRQFLNQGKRNLFGESVDFDVVSAPTAKYEGKPKAESTSQPQPKSPAKRAKPDRAASSRVKRDTSTSRGNVRYEARRVRRVIRHIDPWSVFKVAFIFFLCLWVMFVVAALIVWAIAEGSGTVGQIEKFVQDLLNYEWRLNGDFIFREFGLLGLIMMFACTGMSVVGTVVFNLISDIVGGVWVTVIEEESKRPVSE